MHVQLECFGPVCGGAPQGLMVSNQAVLNKTKGRTKRVILLLMSKVRYLEGKVNVCKS